MSKQSYATPFRNNNNNKKGVMDVKSTFYVIYHGNLFHDKISLHSSWPHVERQIIESSIALSRFVSLKVHWIQQNTAAHACRNLTQYDLTFIPIKLPTNWTFLQNLGSNIFLSALFRKTYTATIVTAPAKLIYFWLNVNQFDWKWISQRELERISTFYILFCGKYFDADLCELEWRSNTDSFISVKILCTQNTRGGEK